MQVLFEVIGRRINQPANIKIPLEKKVLFTVWMLSKPETFLAAGDRYNFSQSTAHRTFYEIVDVIAAAVDDHIKWSTPLQQQKSSEVFKARSGGFNGIIGAIDGCHIQIKKPAGNDHDYYNRKQVHSVILQGICNENCKFINISTGYPGRMHDARVFGLSPIGQELQDNNQRMIAPEHHLIGDAAYRLTPYLLTPYRDTGHLTERQSNYNKKLSSVRSVIERSFGRLKGKFRRLKLLELTNLQFVSQTIMASCVLHNLIIENEGLSDEEEHSDDEDNLPQQYEVERHVNERGNNKRNQIAATLPL
ncbi:putative nuclease HARBI1 [Nilaparvata lugens]|uniref:putative nuclease HARBI1 n=1 Tax=Nilaparvata lugens TaxID=108931 RepID=UPI00193CDC5B|nr:putative nuclease HARBI1 [Nilaparvata lugens]